MSFVLNKNCRFKFEISIESLSVIVTNEFSLVENPINEKIFKYSQPSAPEPIIKIFEFEILF